MRQARGGVLVVGGGFAGGYVARLLGEHGATIVSPENFMLYTPMLPEAASGTLEPRHTVVPLRQMCPHAELVLGRVTAIDEERQLAHVETPDAGTFDVGYDQLVLALGAVPRVFPVPGLAEHGLGFKNLADAIASATASCASSKRPTRSSMPARPPRHLGFVFVGAGYAGVEALAELSDLANDAVRWYPRLRSVPQRWVLVDAAPKILAEIPTRLGDYAAKELTGRGVEIHVSTMLESFDGDEAVLSNGTRIPARTLVWTAGVRASPTLACSGCPSTSAAASASTPSSASRGASASGRSATAPPSRTRGRPAGSTRRPASTRSGRRGGSRRTSSANTSGTDTGCSVRWRPSGATRGSRT